MSFRSIRETQQRVWPAIQNSLERHRRAREIAQNDPLATKAAQARARKPWTRVVMEETVWALAKDDMLASPAASDVVQAARAWAASWAKDPDGPPALGKDDREDVELYNAVQTLLTVIDIPDEIPA